MKFIASEMLGSIFGFFGFAYALLLILLLISRSSVLNSNSLIDETQLIGRRNASLLINKRFEAVESEFQTALKSHNWQYLKKSSSASIAILKSEARDIIMTSAYFDIEPKTFSDFFKWKRFHEVQSRIDPLYEHSELLEELSGSTRIIKKVN